MSVEYTEGLGSVRTKKAPKKTNIGYKVFYQKDGKLYPPMVANPCGKDTPVGVWLDADAAPIVGKSKTGRPQVKNGGKGTQGGSGTLAYRPGWHLGLIPYAIQFNRKDEKGERTLFPKDFVWAEVEYAADKNYQKEAEAEGYTENGKYRHSYAGLKHLPTDGYYIYRTNPNPETDPWIITGTMKVNRILSKKEVDDLVIKAGREPQRVEDEEGLGFASFHISKNEDEFFANIEEAIDKNGVVREDVRDLYFPVLTLSPIELKQKCDLLSFIKKLAYEKNIIGNHKVLVGDSIGVVNISNKFFKKSLSEKSINKTDNKRLQYVSLLNVIEILNNSLDVEIHPNIIKINGDRIFKSENIDKHTLIHRLFSAVKYDGDYYRIKITLKENYKQNNTIYTIENMKIELLSPSKGTPRENVAISNSIPSASLLKGVEKSYEKGVFLLEFSKNMLNGSSSRNTKEEQWSKGDWFASNDPGVVYRIYDIRNNGYKVYMYVDGKLHNSHTKYTLDLYHKINVPEWFQNRDNKETVLSESVNLTEFSEKIAMLLETTKVTFSAAEVMAKQLNLKASNQELIQACELGIVLAARKIAQSGEPLRVRYEKIRDLYDRQPTIQPKDGESRFLQQFSTPAPLAFLAGEFVKGAKGLLERQTKYLEPTAGNGMLTIALPKELTWVNELDEIRYNNLLYQNFGKTGNGDATKIIPDPNFRGVITNPPFASLDKKDYLTKKGTKGGREITYTFTKLDYKLAVMALESMADNGRATIIIGGKLGSKLYDYQTAYWNRQYMLYGEYASFVAYLNRQYNIVDILYISGNLYAKQGTTFPIIMLLIDGRKKWDGRPECVWRRYDSIKDSEVKSFSEYWNRMSPYLEQTEQNSTDNGRKLRLAKAKALLIYSYAQNKESKLY